MFKRRLRESVTIRSIVCFFSLLIVKTGLLAGQTRQTEDDRLYHEVRVNAQIVPVFADDSSSTL